MSISSINTNAAALLAQQNISAANSATADEVAALSSGNRIVEASTDVAALSVGTSLQSQVNILNTALTVASQGSSLLQVADGSLAQIQAILQQQQSVATQAQAGSLSSTQLGFLNEEFQQLTQQIDQLAGTTNFNGVSLLNGALSQSITANTGTSASGSSGGEVNFGANPATTKTITINGASIEFITSGATGAEVNIAGSTAATLANLLTFLNSAGSNSALTATVRDQLSQATYSLSGNSLVVTPANGGTLGQRITLATTATGATVTGGSVETDSVITGINVADLNTAITVGAAAGIDTTTGKILKAFVNSASTAIYTFAAGNKSLNDIVDGINAATATTGYRAYVTGSTGAYTLNVVTADTTGTTPGLDLTAASTAYVTGGTVEASNAVATLAGGANTGLGYNTTIGTGTVGDNILTAQNQGSTTSSISYTGVTNSTLLGSFITIGSGSLAAAQTVFTFTNTASNASPTEILIGSTLQQTLANAVAKINSFSQVGNGEQANILNQLSASVVNGNTLVLTSNDVGGVYDLAGTKVAITTTAGSGGGVGVATGTFAAPGSAASPATSPTINGVDTAGVDTSGVTNAAFVGTGLSGFTAAATSTADQVNLTFTLGGHTYTADNVVTNPSTTGTNLNADGSETVTLQSADGGGSFAITLAANNGVNVGANDTADANTFANRLNSAIGGLTFYQNRQISNYDPASVGTIYTSGTVTGSLTGTSASIQQNGFSSPITISSVAVNAPQGSATNGSIVFTVNGTQYSSSPTIGTSLGANTTYQFVSASDPNSFIDFKTGSTAIDFSTAANAASFQSALNTAFGAGSGSALSFQVGSTSTDTIGVSIGSATSSALFGGQSIDVSSQSDAATAGTVIATALNTVSSLRANVGALESRFTFASNAITSAVQNEGAAKSSLLDTDVAAESTDFATSQVQLQAGIAVLAQANQLQQNLLKLIA